MGSNLFERARIKQCRHPLAGGHFSERVLPRNPCRPTHFLDSRLPALKLVQGFLVHQKAS
jgi:hypothetical protein